MFRRSLGSSQAADANIDRICGGDQTVAGIIDARGERHVEVGVIASRESRRHPSLTREQPVARV